MYFFFWTALFTELYSLLGFEDKFHCKFLAKYVVLRSLTNDVYFCNQELNIDFGEVEALLVQCILDKYVASSLSVSQNSSYEVDVHHQWKILYLTSH